MSDTPLYLYAIVAEEPARAVRGVAFVRAGGAWVAVGHRAVPALSVEAAIEHDRVVRAVARVADAVLPLRFGMSAASERELVKKLAPFRAVIRDGLKRVRGAVQLTMRVGGRELGEKARAARATKGTGPGARFLGRKVAASRLPEIEPLTEALAPYVRDTRIERRAVGKSFASIFFLVERAHLAAWRRVVRATAIPHVTWQITGPWPPYAFAELR